MKRNFHFLRRTTSGNNFMVFFTSFANIFGNSLNIIAGLLVIKWLLPEDLGLFSSFTIVSGYIVLAHLGIPVALNRNLPLLMGKGDKEQAFHIAAVAKYWALFLSITVVFISTVLVMYFIFKGNYEVAVGIVVIAAQTWQGIYVTKYLKVLYKTSKDFNKLAVNGIIVSIISFITIYFVYKYGFYGLVIRAVVIVLTDFLITWYWRPIKVKVQWDKKTFHTMIGIGFPIFIVNNVYGVWPLVQRTLILTLFGTKALGLFSIAFVVSNFFKVFSSSISGVLYPTLMIEWGKGKTIGELFNYNMRKPLLLVSGVLILAIPVMWFTLPIIINSNFPDYVEIIDTTQWMVVAGFFGVFNMLSVFYDVVNKQRSRVITYLVGIGVWAIILFGFSFSKQISFISFPISLIFGYISISLISSLYIKKNWNLKMIHI